MSSILLVEDDLSLIYGLEYSIQKNGFSVDVARTVEEALQIYKEKIMIYCFWMYPYLMVMVLIFVKG